MVYEASSVGFKGQNKNVGYCLCCVEVAQDNDVIDPAALLVRVGAGRSTYCGKSNAILLASAHSLYTQYLRIICQLASGPMLGISY